MWKEFVQKGQKLWEWRNNLRMVIRIQAREYMCDVAIMTFREQNLLVVIFINEWNLANPGITINAIISTIGYQAVLGLVIVFLIALNGFGVAHFFAIFLFHHRIINDRHQVPAFNFCCTPDQLFIPAPFIVKDLSKAGNNELGFMLLAFPVIFLPL